MGLLQDNLPLSAGLLKEFTVGTGRVHLDLQRIHKKCPRLQFHALKYKKGNSSKLASVIKIHGSFIETHCMEIRVLKCQARLSSGSLISDIFEEYL